VHHSIHGGSEIIIENVPHEIEDLNSIQNLDLKYTTTEKQVKKPPTQLNTCYIHQLKSVEKEGNIVISHPYDLSHTVYTQKRFGGIDMDQYLQN
jgi:hypothetical protein